MDSPPTPDAAAPSPHDARPERRARRQRFRETFGVRLLATVVVVLTLATTGALGTAFYVAHNRTFHVLEGSLGTTLEAMARLAANELNKPRLLARAQPATEPELGGELARQRARDLLRETCRALAQRTGASEVVLLTEDGRSVLATSADPATREKTLGRVIADRLDIDRTRKTRRPTSSQLYTARLPGERAPVMFKSGYAPILSEGGAVQTERRAVLAVVGVEMPATFQGTLEQLADQFRFLGALAGLVVLATAYWLIQQRVQLPIRRLVRAMEGEDGAPFHARVRHNDEIGALTERYNRMVDRLAEDERSLRELYVQARATASYLEGYTNHLVAGVPSGVVAVDPAGTLTVWNASAERILGMRGALGQPAGAVLGADHALARALASALAGSVTEQALIALDGDASDPGDPEAGPQRLVELTCAPFHGKQGDPLGAVALVTDRTELEQFRRAASRNERLAAIGHLGAGLAHEIKNPLGAISGFAELIERKKGADAARLASRLRGEVSALNTFLDEFLAFARGDTIRREPTDLAELLVQAIELAIGRTGPPTAGLAAGGVAELALQNGAPLQVEVDVAPDLPALALDATLLRAAFLNLMLNAIQAMPDGGRLAVRVRRADDQVVIRVRDTGPGVPLELRETVFDPLFTTRAEGTGLGLAIAHKTVTAHGGKLTVRDAPGGGAEFVTRLPIVETAASPARED